jgi:two-component system NarL family response regulator
MPANILIVDDQEFMRSGIRAMITRWRPEWTLCGEAANGEDAIRAVIALKPDVVIMDVSMPRMDGIEAASRIAKVSRSTRVLLVSGFEPKSLALSAEGDDARGYVDKGRVIWDLIPAIDMLLARVPLSR